MSIASATLGAVGAFSISRWVAGDAVEELGGPRLRAASEWVGQRGFRSVLYARIAPAVPYTLVNYAAGLTPVRLGAFTAATAIGVAPRAFAYTALGGSLGHLDSPEALIAVGVLVAMALGGLALAHSERDRRRPPRGRPLELLDLQQARRARAPARQPGGDPDPVARTAPAELDDAPRGVGDQRLGRLVAAHRGGLHAPHQPAAPHRLLARRERVDRDRGPVGGDQPRRAPRERGDDQRGQVQLARGDAGVVGERVGGVAVAAAHATLAFHSA